MYVYTYVEIIWISGFISCHSHTWPIDVNTFKIIVKSGIVCCLTKFLNSFLRHDGKIWSIRRYKSRSKLMVLAVRYNKATQVNPSSAIQIPNDTNIYFITYKLTCKTTNPLLISYHSSLYCHNLWAIWCKFC